MSVTAGFVIVMVLLARQLLKRVPRKFSYCLWLIVAFRLVCPYSIPSGISMFNLEFFRDRADTGSQVIWSMSDMLNADAGEENGGLEGVNGTVLAEEERDGQNTKAEDQEATGREMNNGASGSERIPGKPDAESADGDGVKSGTAKGGLSLAGLGDDGKGIFGGTLGTVNRAEVLALIWMAGVAVFLLYQLGAYVKLRRRVETAVQFGEGIYECDRISTPFVMGFFSPRIYLPFRMTEKEHQYILLHEKYHIRRKDHQVKVLAVLILAVHWFNPLVWAAYHFMCKDMEMSCDEMVIGRLGNKVKEEYSRSLLGFAARGQGWTAAPLAFGEVPVKTRIKNVLRFQSPKRAALLFGVVICVAVAVAGIGNGRKRSGLRYAGWRSISTEGNLDFERVVSYKYELPDTVRSLVVYKEYYRNGVQESYSLLSLQEIGEEQQKGTFTIDRELFRKGMDEYDATFSLDFPGEEVVMDAEALEENGFDGVAETFYMERDDGWNGIVPDEDIVITAWNLSTKESDGVQAFPCVDFMDESLKWDARAENAGVVLYHLVFSEKSMQELEQEYTISPYVKELYALKNPYIGDAVGDGKLIRALAVAPKLARTMELKTEKEPYTLILHFEDGPENEADFYHSMTQKATVLLMMIENASSIEWTYPAESDGVEGERHFSWSVEQAKEALGVDNLQTFTRDEMALQAFFEEDFQYAHPFYEALDETEQGTIAPNGTVFPYESTVIGKIPGDAYDSVFSVLAMEENPSIVDVETALQEGGSSERLYVKKEKCAKTERVQVKGRGENGKQQGFLAENGRVYPYRQVMTGRHPNAASDSTYLVYSDEPEIKFQDITDYFFSSDSTKSFREDMYVRFLEDDVEGD